MTESEFIGLLDANLRPQPYSEALDGPESVIRLLQLRSLGTRYALAVIRWTDGVPGRDQLRLLRVRMKTHFRAHWPFSQVGMIVLFLGSTRGWDTAVEELRPDLHGLHPVIFQGVIYLDLEAVRVHIARSEWGPLKFGNIQGQFSRVHDFLQDLQTPP